MYREFWQLFVKGYGGGRAFLVITMVTILVALLEGMNVGLLIPLLESLDSTESGDAHWVSRTLAKVFDIFGLNLDLNTMLIALAGLVVLNAGLKYIKTILVVKTGIGFMIWLRSTVLENYLRADVSYFHKEELGRMSNTLFTQTDRATTTFNVIVEMFTSAGVAFAYLIAALFISPLLTAIAIGTMAIVTLAMQFFISRAASLGTQVVRAYSDLEADGIENLTGIQVIKSFILERTRSNNFRDKSVSAGKINYLVDMNRGQSVVVQEVALFALIGGIVYVAVSIANLNLAVTVALLFVLYRMAPRVNSLNSLRQSLAVSMASVHHVKTTLEEVSKIRIASGELAFNGLEQEIELKNVSYHYEEGTPVLQHTNFVAEKGKMTALIGSSGAGKSTLIDLILRFYDPVEGQLLVDDVNLKELDLESWRRSIGVVSQDTFLFNESIAENISMGNPGMSFGDVKDAAKQAYAHDFIQQLPEGYDTVVGDRGSNLSGGQRQRIALARAIMRQPEILILDEATSSLDSESERLIQEYIQGIQGNRTIIVVAHRMSTIQNSDKIAVLENGAIVEEGDWDSLLAADGIFARYHRLQFRS